MSNLMQRVRAHTTGQRTSGQNTLVLAKECIDHMFGDSGDWTPLAFLIGRSEPAQGRAVRRIAGKIIQGYTLRSDPSQPSGLRFIRLKARNQGVDGAYMRKLEAFVRNGLSIQSKAVTAAFAPEKAADKPVEEQAKQHIKREAKFLLETGFDLDTYIMELREAVRDTVVEAEPAVADAA